jgi:hypothetical protein
MVKIQQTNDDFVKNNKSDIFTSSITYDYLCSSVIISKNTITKIKRTKISLMVYGSCIVNEKTHFFKVHTNFMVIDNSKKIFLCNVTINQVNITNNEYVNIADDSDDDYVENIIYDLIEKLFISSNCSKNIQKNEYVINFNIPSKNNFNDDTSTTITNLSFLSKIGIFYNNL